MLLKKTELEAIKTGKTLLVFRRWRRSNVKTGGTLKTAVGILAIDRITEIDPSDITECDAAAAGYASLSKLLDQLDARDGNLYQIQVRYAGADPRLRLREDDVLDDAELVQISRKLDRLDSASRIGNWTRQVLRAIKHCPNIPAADLAKQTKFEKEWLKTNIRKLKNLGLTISQQPGYELSPRGQVVLKYLESNA